MNLLTTIENDLKLAIKSRQEDELRTLRMLKSDIMYEKARGSEDITEEKVLEVISRASKRRRESIDEFTKAGRKDLADLEAAELVIIEKYLPRQLGADEVAAVIEAKIAELGISDKKEFGKLMGAVMKDLKGQADGGLVREMLTKKMENL